jgi:DNA-binding HxlR family transcriptional regulator
VLHDSLTSEQIAALVRDRLVEKCSDPIEHKTLYALTEDGRKLVELLMPLAAWDDNRLDERGLRWIRPVPCVS